LERDGRYMANLRTTALGLMVTTVVAKLGGAGPRACSQNVNGNNDCVGGAREPAWASGDTGSDEPNTSADVTTSSGAGGRDGRAEHLGPSSPSACVCARVASQARNSGVDRATVKAERPARGDDGGSATGRVRRARAAPEHGDRRLWPAAQGPRAWT